MKMTTCEQLASFEQCEIVPIGCIANGCQISKGAETNTSERCTTPPIPEGTRPLQLQAAGHVFGRANGQKKNKIGFLQADDGTVLKPVLERKGLRELNFYKYLFSSECDTSVLHDLRAFVPKFMGIWTTPVHPGQNYIRLKNVTGQFQKPSVMDVKVGPITYDCEADEAKKVRESKKFPALNKVGFQVVGIKRYVVETASYRNIERTFLRTLDEKTILTEGLAKFVCAKELVSTFLLRLRSIESWFRRQNLLCFIASSLLFVYDSEAVHRQRQCITSKQEHSLVSEQSINNNYDYYDVADVRIIDLTHVFPTDGLDVNYLTGLCSLIAYLSELETGLVDC